MLDWGDRGGVIHAPISCWLPGWASRVVRTRKAVVDNIDAVLSYRVEGTAWERHIGNMEHSSTKNIERTPQLVPIRDKLILPSVPSTELKNTKKRQAIVLQLAFQWSNTHEMNTINTPRYRMILLHISSTGCWSWSSPRRRMIDGKSGGRPVLGNWAKKLGLIEPIISGASSIFPYKYSPDRCAWSPHNPATQQITDCNDALKSGNTWRCNYWEAFVEHGNLV